MHSDAGENAESTNPYVNPTQSVSGEPAQMTEQRAAASAALVPYIVRAANWFYWIAGLSLVNLGAIVIGSNFRFVIGLGFSEILGDWAKAASANGDSSGTVLIACAGGLILAALFAACGWFARRPSLWAFLGGIAIFALDTIIFILAGDWIGVAFHVYAIYCLWRGVTATRHYKMLMAS